MKTIVIDSNALVAIVDLRDTWHAKATELIQRITQQQQVNLVYFDCVLNETLSVLGRRLEEQKRSHEFIGLVGRLRMLIPDDAILWVSLDIKRLYPDILALLQETSGKLNFHDALIALKCLNCALMRC